MTDFFAHLAARARDTVATVRPRVPLPFEPPPPGPAQEPNAPFETEVVEEAGQESQPEAPSRPEPLFLSPPPTPYSPAEALTPRASPGAPHAVDEAPTPPVATPPIVPARPAVPQASFVAAPDAQPAAAPAPEPIATPRRAPSESPKEQPQTAAPVPPSRDEKLPPRVSPRPPGIQPDAPREAPIPDVTAISPRAATSELARTARAALPPIPLVTPRGERARREAAFERQSISPGEATIHVSIGRIEVRATPTAPARERAPAASPVMSLDEYLRTHAGRARS